MCHIVILETTMQFALLLVINLLAVFHTGYGFINVESLRQHEGQGLKGKSTLGLSGRSGSVNKFQGELDILKQLSTRQKRIPSFE